MRPTCPFCHATISVHLAAHGGPCPSCFAEIPGEEAATNPGEDVLAQQDAEARARAARRQRRPVLIALPIVVALVLAAAWSLRPAPVVEALAFDDEEFTIEPEYAQWKGDEAPAEDAAPSATPRAARPARTGAKLTGPGDVPTSAPDATAAATGVRRRTGDVAPPGGVRDIGGATVGGSAEADADMDISFAAKRTAAMLTSRDDISKAVKDMLRARVPRLQQCFDRALKANPDLAGHWKLAFTIGEDGKASEMNATGVEMHDDAFESCIVRDMQGWGIYARLAKPWPVTLPVSFKNEG